MKLVKQYNGKKLFNCEIGHEHKAFPKYRSRVIDLDADALKEWIMKNGLREFNRKHYYKQFQNI